MRTSASLLLLAIATAPVACTEGDATDDDRDDAVSDEYVDSGKGDGQSQPKVKASGMTLWVDANATVERRNGQLAVVIHGRTSKNIAEVFSWVPDDAFGEALQTSARKFDVVLFGDHEVNTLLSGLPINVDINTSVGTIRNYHARITVAPRFARFGGDNGLWIDSGVRPVFMRNAEPTLAYRSRVHADEVVEALTVTTTDHSDPAVTRVDDTTWSFGWTYPQLAPVLDPTDVIEFTAELPDDTIEKHAGIDLRVVDVQLTTLDPYDTGPTPSCDPAVYACIAATHPQQSDLGHCGDYRPVQRCVYADACEVQGPQPLALSPIDATSLVAARDAYVAGCDAGGNGQWCSMGDATAYTVPGCPDETLTMERLAELVAAERQGFPSSGGTHLINAQLDELPAFATGYSAGGPAWREALASFAGSGHVEAYYVTSEVPCQNCTDFADTYVLFYSLVNRVIAFDAGHGFDS
jgi:hypothetical protein